MLPDKTLMMFQKISLILVKLSDLRFSIAEEKMLERGEGAQRVMKEWRGRRGKKRKEKRKNKGWFRGFKHFILIVKNLQNSQHNYYLI